MKTIDDCDNRRRDVCITVAAAAAGSNWPSH